MLPVYGTTAEESQLADQNTIKIRTAVKSFQKGKCCVSIFCALWKLAAWGRTLIENDMLVGSFSIYWGMYLHFLLQC